MRVILNGCRNRKKRTNRVSMNNHRVLAHLEYDLVQLNDDISQYTGPLFLKSREEGSNQMTDEEQLELGFDLGSNVILLCFLKFVAN